jgi:REP element-mobilizing transposase RayT
MLTKPTYERLLPGKSYHIFNRAVGDELLFRNDEDYLLFLQNLKRFILSYASVYAYCLMPNHFHFLLKIRDIKELNSDRWDHNQLVKKINQSFSNFFNSYAVIYNRTYGRKGKLFMLPYKRILVEDLDYFLTVVNYIHRNPLHHGLVEEYPNWKFSSLSTYLENKHTFVATSYVLELFGGLERMMFFHQVDMTGDTG